MGSDLYDSFRLISKTTAQISFHTTITTTCKANCPWTHGNLSMHNPNVPSTYVYSPLFSAKVSKCGLEVQTSFVLQRWLALHSSILVNIAFEVQIFPCDSAMKNGIKLEHVLHCKKWARQSELGGSCIALACNLDGAAVVVLL